MNIPCHAGLRPITHRRFGCGHSGQAEFVLHTRLRECNKRFQVSVFRFQDRVIRFPDTRNLTPDTKNLRDCMASGFTAPQGPFFPNSIINIYFPGKAGFMLRCNRLSRVGNTQLELKRVAILALPSLNLVHFAHNLSRASRSCDWNDGTME